MEQSAGSDQSAEENRHYGANSNHFSCGIDIMLGCHRQNYNGDCGKFATGVLIGTIAYVGALAPY